MRSSVFSAFFFLVTCLPGSVQALPVDDLYVADVLVATEDERELAAGARAGLVQVLIKVSGDPGVQSSTLVRSALSNPEQYYYQYGYESTDRQLVVDGEVIDASNLKIHFEPSAIARLLREAGFPVWGSNRPAVMLWIAVNDENGRRILTEYDDNPLVDALIDRAALRGIPLLFPLQDLEDQASISAAEVWGAFLGKVEAASLRYNPDVILTARIQRERDYRWTAQWAWQISRGWSRDRGLAETPGALAAPRMDALANELAGLYALDSSQGEVHLVTGSVGGVADYARLKDYLASLSPVVGSHVLRVAGDEVEMLLQIEGQVTQLRQIIELDEKLMFLNADESADTLYYRWMEPAGP